MTNEQLERYSRNILLKEVGIRGQQKLLSSKILIIGAGGLSSAATLYLVAAGVGTIGIADKDKVELSNLNRQIIHNTNRVGILKTESAKQTIKELNPDIKINIYNEISSENISEIVSQYDFIIDATDNFETKFLINDACVKGKKAFSHAGIEECVSSCAKDGVLGAAVGVIGTLQATEAIKYILDIGELLTGHLLTYNALTCEFRKIKLPPSNKDCPACGKTNP